MFSTRRKILLGVLSELSLVDGTSVQTYSEPIINNNIQNAFDHFYKKVFWKHLTNTSFHELDGAGGVITDDLSGLEDMDDIKWIRQYPYREKDYIPYVEDGIFDSNNLQYTSMDWKNPQYTTKMIQFHPKEDTAQIAIRARRKPDDFAADDDIVPIDRLLMIHFITSAMLSIDGLNPGEAARQQGLMDDRFTTLMEAYATQPIRQQRDRYSGQFTVAEET